MSEQQGNEQHSQRDNPLPNASHCEGENMAGNHERPQCTPETNANHENVMKEFNYYNENICGLSPTKVRGLTKDITPTQLDFYADVIATTKTQPTPTKVQTIDADVGGTTIATPQAEGGKSHTQTHTQHITHLTYAQIVKSNSSSSIQDHFTIKIENITTKDSWKNIATSLDQKLKNFKPYTLQRTTFNSFTAIIPKDNTHIEEIRKILLDQNTYEHDKFGTPYTHDTQTKTGPWLCINRISPREKLETISQALNNASIHHTDIRRMQNGFKPSWLIMFKLEDFNTQTLSRATETPVKIGGKTSQIRLYIEKTALRCTKCQKLGHDKKDCKQKHTTCVRCAGSKCKIMDCKSNNRKCVNCGGKHPSSYSSCKKLKEYQNKVFQSKVNAIKEQAFQETNNLLLNQQANIAEQNKKLTEELKKQKEINEKHEAEIKEMQEVVKVNRDELNKIILDFRKYKKEQAVLTEKDKEWKLKNLNERKTLREQDMNAYKDIREQTRVYGDKLFNDTVDCVNKCVDGFRKEINEDKNKLTQSHEGYISNNKSLTELNDRLEKQIQDEQNKFKWVKTQLNAKADKQHQEHPNIPRPKNRK